MATQPNIISTEDYLQLEVEALDRHEYLNGDMVAMSGGSANHSLIGTNILAFLQPRSGDCTVCGPDMRIRTSPAGLYTYADAVVSCADERIEADTLLNPRMIVEVLSPSTENYDRGRKFELYRQIDSFREYLIVAQDRAYAEHYLRANPTSWTMHVYDQPTFAIDLQTMACSIQSSDIYARVKF